MGRMILKYALSLLLLFQMAAYADFFDPQPSALMVALESNASYEEIVQLVENGEDVNEVFSEMIRAYKPVLRYALDRKMDFEYLPILQFLLDNGANVNTYTYNRVENKKVYGMMPLICYAVIYSSPDAVSLFIQYGADVNVKMDKSSIDCNKRALTYARQLKKKATEQLLIEAGGIE